MIPTPEKALQDTLGQLLWQLTIVQVQLQAMTAERDALKLALEAKDEA